MMENNYERPALDCLYPGESNQSDPQSTVQIMQELTVRLRSIGIEFTELTAENGPVRTRVSITPRTTKDRRALLAQADTLLLDLVTAPVLVSGDPSDNGAVVFYLPRERHDTVRLRSVLESDAFRWSGHALPAALGCDALGNPLVIGIEKAPHILITGTTGSGKTTLLYSFLVSLLYAAPPEKLQMVLIDPKGVELFEYRKLPHLARPSCVKLNDALQALDDTVEEMERRYHLFSKESCFNLDMYNRKIGKQDPAARLPYIIVVIDEVEPLMRAAHDRCAGALLRLVQKARAAGIHLIVTTQSASGSVLDANLCANFPTRIAFRAVTGVDSKRVLLGHKGAERLCAPGEFLWMEPSDDTPACGIAAYVSSAEAEAFCDRIRA